MILSSDCDTPSLSKTTFFRFQSSDDINLFQHHCQRSLRGQNVNASAFVVFPYTIYNEETKEFKGSDIEVIQAMAKMFEFNLRLSNGEPWSQDPETGKWSDIVGEILDGRVQFGIGPVGINKPSNDLALSFTPLTYTLDIILFVGKPQPLEPFLNFLRPFPAATWLFVMISFLLGVITFHLLEDTHQSWIMALLKIVGTHSCQCESDIYLLSMHYNKRPLQASLVAPNTKRSRFSLESGLYTLFSWDRLMNATFVLISSKLSLKSRSITSKTY